MPCIDSTRVKLSKDQYIHANWVKFSSQDIGVRSILTQGPLASTTQTFWEMIWEYQVETIVGIIEHSGLPKRCETYWPYKQDSIQLNSFKVIKNGF